MNTQLLNQKVLILILGAIFLMPGMAFSDGEDFDEITYVYRTFEWDAPVDLQECIELDTPFVPNWASKWDLYSFHSKKTNGLVLNDDIKRIGQTLGCADVSGFGDDIFGPIPVYFKVNLDGMELFAEGQGRWLSIDVPEDLVVMHVAWARIIGGPPEIIGGSMVSNALGNAFGLPGYVSGAFSSIRLFTPAVNDDD